MGQIVRYVHHGVQVFVDSHLKGKHRAFDLCFRCDKFFPVDHPEKVRRKPKTSNCPRSQRIYLLCRELNVVTPVWECPEFTPRAFSNSVKCPRCGSRNVLWDPYEGVHMCLSCGKEVD